ncbi:MAG: glycosyltransferase family 2 protein [Gammaproteobacteria bacterium]|nr:MAG: glycosyltransferase family 2 protein [Gammaproteobacteria bacterium]
MATPRVSIAVPAYNCERYLAKSLDSLLGQTYGDFELVISDNASTDGSEEICRRYERLDQRVRYIRRTDNIGGPGNFRYVWSQCRGEYHKWSTADDYWAPGFLGAAVALLDARPDVVLCHPRAQLVDSAGGKIEDYDEPLHLVDDSPRRRFNQLLQTIRLCNAHLGLIRRAAMACTRLIGTEMNSDTHFLAELTLYGKFSLLPEIMFFRRFHPQSSSWKRDDDSHQETYYDPGRKDKRGMHGWRKFARLSGGVWRAPISVSDKLALTVDLGRYARWERHRLGRELTATLSGRRN